MLVKLSIQNYLLIQQAEFNISKGFTVITGETGAGKSILLGAIGLILGNRADSQVLYDKEKKCIVEGEFIIDSHYKAYFQDHDIDFDNHSIIRREINVNGKSRAFVNDTPVKLSVLKGLSENLIDIHSQFSNSTFTSLQFPYDLIDSYAGIVSQVEKYKFKFKEYKSEINHLNILKDKLIGLESDKDYFQFQYDELDKIIISDQELIELIAEQKIIENSGKINTTLKEVIEELENGSGNASERLNSAVLNMQDISSIKSEFEELMMRLQSVSIELKDILSDLELETEKVLHDPFRLDDITNRISVIYSLFSKHRVDTIKSLKEKKKEYKNRLTSSEDLDKEITELTHKINQDKSRLLSTAIDISNKRKLIADKLSNSIEKELKNLELNKAEFKINIEHVDDVSIQGLDKINLLFASNPALGFSELHKAASGGEQARIMLSIKSVLSKKMNFPVTIFDEIDTGVSGKIAGKMASLMKKMANSQQIISITHLPQVAAKGDFHFKIEKNEIEKPITEIKELVDDERLDEIAKLLSDDKISDAAIQNAKVLLGNS